MIAVAPVDAAGPTAASRAPDPKVYPRWIPDADPPPFRPVQLAYQGATAEAIADEIAAHHDLATPEGWTEAMRALAARPEVLRRLVRALADDTVPTRAFHAALRYVTENGVGKPVERHEHTHRGTVGHVLLAPPIAWTDEVHAVVAATEAT